MELPTQINLEDSNGSKSNRKTVRGNLRVSHKSVSVTNSTSIANHADSLTAVAKHCRIIGRPFCHGNTTQFRRTNLTRFGLATYGSSLFLVARQPTARYGQSDRRPGQSSFHRTCSDSHAMRYARCHRSWLMQIEDSRFAYGQPDHSFERAVHLLAGSLGYLAGEGYRASHTQEVEKDAYVAVRSFDTRQPLAGYVS